MVRNSRGRGGRYFIGKGFTRTDERFKIDPSLLIDRILNQSKLSEEVKVLVDDLSLLNTQGLQWPV
jgi:hypothetical protein